MNDSPSGIKKVPIRVIVLIIMGTIYLFSKSDINMDSVINTIALVLFAATLGYYLFPQVRERRRKHPAPKHKQYDDNRLTDYMMERIMSVYNVKERADGTYEKPNAADIRIDIDESKAETDVGIDDEAAVKFEAGYAVGLEDVEEEINEDPEEGIDEGVEEEIEEEPKHYEDSRLTDYMMKKIMKAYNVQEQPDESDEEVDDNAEEIEEENDEALIDNEMGFEGTYEPVLYNTDHGEETNTGIKALFSPAQLPVTLAGLWLFMVIAVYSFFPEIGLSISKFIPLPMFATLPVLFLIGLSGLIGILFKESTESLEVTAKERITYSLNIFKIIIGWGAGLYVFLINN